MKKKKVRKPREIISDKLSIEYNADDNVLIKDFDEHSVVRFDNLKEIKRLKNWLEKFIEWKEQVKWLSGVDL